MWMPTHIQLTIQRAKDLLVKGKHGTNDCFVVMSLGKEKFQTSVKEKAQPNVEWREECELTIPRQGNTADIRLAVLHRNFLGVDEFLGQTSIPLADYDVYERPKNRWYKLHSKPDKKDTKQRGELEVRLGFTVKAACDSAADLSQRGSLLSLPRAGPLSGSMASLGRKKKSLGKLAAAVGHKVAKVGRKKSSSRGGSEAGSEAGSDLGWDDGVSSNAEPGVISEGEEDQFGIDDEHGGPAIAAHLNSRRLPKPLDDETPLSSLASSVQSGLSDVPAISERVMEPVVGLEAASVPSPLVSTEVSRDEAGHWARPDSSRSSAAGSARSSGRYCPPDSGLTRSPMGAPEVSQTAQSAPRATSSATEVESNPFGHVETSTPVKNATKVNVKVETGSGEGSDKNPPVVNQSVPPKKAAAPVTAKSKIDPYDKTRPVFGERESNPPKAATRNPPNVPERNPFVSENGPFSEDGPNPFDDDELNPFAGNGQHLAEEEWQNPFSEDTPTPCTDERRGKPVSSHLPRFPTDSTRSPAQRNADDTPPVKENGRDRVKKRDKLEKMMKKTPQIFRNLAGKKDDSAEQASERVRRQDTITPSPSLSLLPLSDSSDLSGTAGDSVCSRRVVEGGNEQTPEMARVPADVLRRFEGISRERLIELVADLQEQVSRSREELKRSRSQTDDLEEYVDTLLLRVMDVNPELLHCPTQAVSAKYVGRHG